MKCRLTARKTMKMDCKATVFMKEVIMYPDYKVSYLPVPILTHPLNKPLYKPRIGNRSTEVDRQLSLLELRSEKFMVIIMGGCQQERIDWIT